MHDREEEDAENMGKMTCFCGEFGAFSDLGSVQLFCIGIISLFLETSVTN